LKYYDLKRNWRKVKIHIEHPEVQALLVRDFDRYTWGRWRQKFEPGMHSSNLATGSSSIGEDRRPPPTGLLCLRHSTLDKQCFSRVVKLLTMMHRVVCPLISLNF
jgi:hypothetical protein